MSATPPTPPTVWLTIKQAAERLQCSTGVIYRMIRAGQLAATRIGGRRALRIRSEWLDAALESTRVD